MKKGIECEGIYSGMQTLFVTGNDFATKYLEDIVAFAQKEPRCSHIYLGADKDPIYKANYDKAVELAATHHVTLEVPEGLLEALPLSIVSKVHLMVRIEVTSQLYRLKATDQIKVETPTHCHITTIGQTLTNELNYLDSEV
jgi:hypothetical protein